jgi:HK97 family phage major capsid protein/HK97 family phage prohead protease
MLQRAYSVLNVKHIDEMDDHYVIRGTATTPAADRANDVVMPMGAKFKLPLPLLWQHDSKKPVGNVVTAAPTKKGIPVEMHIPKVKEAGALKDRIDEAVQSIKYKLVLGLSIGFKPLEDAYEWLENGGIQFNVWEWLELSLVTIPMQAEASLTSIKSLDAEQLAASGLLPPVIERKSPPGASGKPNLKPKPKEGKTMTLAEQIAAFEAKRAAKAARMAEIMEKSAEAGETLDDAQAEEYDTLKDEVEKIDAHLVRLAEQEKALVAKATALKAARNQEEASNLRGGNPIISVKSNLPKGTSFTRYAIALAKSKGNLMQAAEIAKGWHDSTPEVETVLKAAIAAGTTTDATWAAPLVEYNTMTGEFIELLRPATIIGRIPGLRRVPFNISMPRQTSGSSVAWVGEGKAKPLSKGAFDTVTLRWAKAAGIVVLTDELVRFSNPSAEALVRQDLIEAMAVFLDRQFVDPSVAEVANVSPASITNGVVARPASGTDIEAVYADFEYLFAQFLAANLSMAGAVIIMTEQQAMRLSMMRNALGQREFPDVNSAGGVLFGLPVITSENALATEDAASPQQYEAGGLIILAKASEIMLADDGQVMLDASREASVQMDSEPAEPTTDSTVLVSLWQRNMVGLKAERWINWKKRRSAAVQYITGANYSAASS